MAETMIERVARALVAHRINEPGWDGEVDEFELGQACAAIAAMREPTEDMVEAGARPEFGLALVRMWEDMIDAALKEDG